MALLLHGVISLDGHRADRPVDGTRSVSVRDLGAIVTDRATFTAGDGEPGSIDAHRAVVDAAFKRGSVLPAPVGVVFRSDDVLEKWMELHYVALSDALEFVEDRAGARVHICRSPECGPEDAAGADLAAAAADAYKALRKRAVSTVALRVEHLTGIILAGAFLVERARWSEFTTGVDELRAENAKLSYAVSGPWPPYDFVRMQFGA